MSKRRGARFPAPGGPSGLRRIVAGSLLAGGVLAGILTMGAFGGAREHVITGSGLLGFGLGWAMLAMLSSRMTSEPQRWALVPAVAMTATGLGLLVLAPDDRALTAAGWVWPPLLFALAVWMGVQTRRSIARGGGRWALFSVVGLMILAAVGGMIETVALASNQRLYPMPGQSYDVGGYDLHLDCTGSGSPTVVLLSGLGEFSPNWARIVSSVGGTTGVCAYDRAGQGWSEDAPHAQDGLEAADDLRTLLRGAGEQGPFVLAGHSIGGPYAMTYAARYPEEVAGMVLLDSTDPYQASPVMGSPQAGAVLGILPSLSRLGIPLLFPTSFWSNVPEPAAGQIQALSSTPRARANYRDESTMLPVLLYQAQALTSFESKPLIVITADASQDRPAAHDRMTDLSSNSSHRFTDETHAGLLEDDSGARVSARAINDLVEAVRTGSEVIPG